MAAAIYGQLRTSGRPSSISNSSLVNTIYEKLDIKYDKRKEFKAYLTIGRLKSKNINYNNFNIFKKLIHENKNLEFGTFKINEVKLKKSVLTPKGPTYSDLVY